MKEAGMKLKKILGILGIPHLLNHMSIFNNFVITEYIFSIWI